MTTVSNRSDGIVVATLVGDQVYDFLEKQILTGHLPGGTRLRVRQLADVVGTSVQPVRDAISRLEETGLAEKAPHRGAVVKEFSVPELIEIYAVRGLLEVEAAREGAAAITEDGLTEMQAALDEMERALDAGRVGEAMAADSHMLRVLYRSSGNSLLCNLIETLWKQCHYYRIVGATTAHENNDDSIWEPSRRILAAARKRDSDAAAQATSDSLDNATQRLKSRHNH
jgi:DNA-binding GntR family transcriptional regulator